MYSDQSCFQRLRNQFCKVSAVVTLAFLATSAIAQTQPYEGRFRGNSTSWRPDYVGTLQMELRSNHSFTATADVELRRVRDVGAIFDPAIARYEMRGEIRITSPVTISGGGRTFVCTTASPVPVRISQSQMMIYSGDEEFPRNSYEIRVFQDVRINNCVSPTGQSVGSLGNRSLEVNFDSSQMVFDSRPLSNQPIPQAPAFTPNEQAILRQQAQTAEDMANNPEFQRELRRLEQQAMRTGRPPSEAEVLAIVERLQRSGAIPREVPTLSPERQAQLRRDFPTGKIDYSHLRRFTNLNQLQDRLNVTTRAGSVQTFSWNLRRVNGR